MAQDKAVTNSTAGEAITDTQNNKGVKVSKGNLRALKGRLKASRFF